MGARFDSPSPCTLAGLPPKTVCTLGLALQALVVSVLSGMPTALPEACEMLTGPSPGAVRPISALLSVLPVPSTGDVENRRARRIVPVPLALASADEVPLVPVANVWANA